MTSRRQFLAGAACLGAFAPRGAFAQAGPAASPAAGPAPAPAALPVTATFSILADFVSAVGGERIALGMLVQPGGDAHDYSPSPADSRRLAASRLIVVNGLGFEGWVNRLIRSSGAKAPVVVATRGVKALKAKAGGHDHGGHSHGEEDPHAWQSIPNAKLYVANIAAGLVEADPAGKEAFEANAKAYSGRLDALDAEIRAILARVPASRRKVILSHDSFQYFEKQYGIEFISPRGVSTGAEPSPQAIGRIIRQIRTERIAAVFLENVSDQRLMKRIADETGAAIGGTLYSDALTPPGGPASTYVDMMRHNAKQLAGALGVA